MFISWLGTLPGAAALGIIWGIMAIGVYMTYKILDIADLTVDGSICTGGAVCAVLITNGVDFPIAMLAAFGAGLLAGFFTGILHTFMGIPAILAGILTQLVLWSVNLKIMGTSFVAVPSRNYDVLIALMEPMKALVVTLIFAVVLIVVLYCFYGTELGSSLRATGNNPNMSRAQGINTNAMRILGLTVSNGIVALSGALLTQFNGSVDISMGRGAIVIGLAAVIIGEAVFSNHFTNLGVKHFGVIIGGIIYYFIYQTVIFIGLDAELLKMLSALVVAVFLAVPYWKQKYFTKAKGIKKNA